MRLDLGIFRDRLWTIEYYRRDAWNKEDRAKAWTFLCHWPRYDDYWFRVFGLTLSGRKGLAKRYRQHEEPRNG